MKTIIFKSYEEFLSREDGTINGVSEDFAKENPNYYTDNETNIGCWNCSSCSDCSYCRSCSYCSGCSSCSGCSYSSYCSSCSDCSYCSYCRSCSYCVSCVSCSYCRDLENKIHDNVSFIVPIIDNIHQKIYDVTSREGSLNMETWHTCDTTHCRAGWVAFLAGEEGKRLEEATDTLFAAMQIYKKSSPDITVSHRRFFESNEKALEDIKRCAEEEKKLQKTILIKHIQDICCLYFGINSSEFSNRTRSQAYVKARSCYCYFHKKYVNGSETLKRLGEIIGQDIPYDHTTVINGLRNIDNWLLYDKPFQKMFKKMEQEILSALKVEEISKEKKEVKMNYYDVNITVIMNEKHKYECQVDYTTDSFGNLNQSSVVIKEMIHRIGGVLLPIKIEKLDKEYLSLFKKEIITQIEL